MESKINYLKQKLKENGGKWLGFKIGKNNEVIVRIRRSNRKHFYLTVDKYIADNKVIVKDIQGKEHGVEIRFNRDSFSLEPTLSDK